jgi:amino acid permease
MSSKVALPLLLLLSGFCGISYEILYTRLLGNLLGNQFIIGPYNETFSLVLVSVFLGLAAGSTLVGLVGLSFSGAILLCLAGLALVLGALPAVAAAYASLYPSVAPSYWPLVLLKFGFVFALMGLPAIASLAEHRRKREEGVPCASVRSARKAPPARALADSPPN